MVSVVGATKKPGVAVRCGELMISHTKGTGRGLAHWSALSTAWLFDTLQPHLGSAPVASRHLVHIHTRHGLGAGLQPADPHCNHLEL